MAVLENTDAAAIARLDETIALQRAAFLRDPYPSAAERRERLQALAGMMVGHRTAIREAVSSDFAVHPEPFTDLIETLAPAGRAAFAAEQLETWMAPEPRYVDAALFGSARASMRYEPKGVVGNIVPWNFPFELACGPLVEMLAAGNRVVLKPSEYTPACAELLRDMVAATFDRDLVDVAVGGLELAQAFPARRWDHLLYTGSPGVGRLVAKAAAENLVPVTLELGGKCPAIVAPDSIDARTVEQVVGTKLIKNGQMCISVDHCLVPRDALEEFVGLAQQHMADRLPDYSRTADCTGIISERHLDRLVGLLDEARDAGVRLVQLDPDGALDRGSRRMPVTLVVDPPADLALMQEEIFGPILPVIGYDDLDDAIARVNAGDRPLGLYVFSGDDATTERVLRETHSGGAAVNTCAMQGALPSLGFGGSGTSGSGRHHGIEGFREFSNPRGIFVRGDDGDLLEAFMPPYAGTTAALVDSALHAG